MNQKQQNCKFYFSLCSYSYFKKGIINPVAFKFVCVGNKLKFKLKKINFEITYVLLLRGIFLKILCLHYYVSTREWSFWIKFPNAMESKFLKLTK